MSTPPVVVQHLLETVRDKLGRPAHSRQVKNKEEWYVCDPVFSFVQHGMKKGTTGYRVGFKVDLPKHELWFELVHSPLMARLFKRNLVLSSLAEVVKSTAVYRNRHCLYRSSNQVFSTTGQDGAAFHSPALPDFVSQIEAFDKTYGFAKDLFPKRENTGKKGGKAPCAGNTFYLLLADKPETLASRSDVARVVSAAWPLFLWLYPAKPIQGRSANLARHMKAKGIPQVCEFSKIQFPAGVSIPPQCDGSLQGAHIKPEKKGGSDRPENGLWLCELHHQATEGKLEGKRDDAMQPQVRFIQK